MSYGVTPAVVSYNIPALTLLPAPFSLLTYQFMHANIFHLMGNMLFLWVFGDDIERALGRGWYLAFYLLCGIAAGGAYVLSAPTSVMPLVGASGAIAGVVAAYLMLRPCAKIVVLAFGFVPLRLGSAWVLGFWILVQVWHIMSDEKGDTAWWAHIGGLAVGGLLILVMRPPGVELFECFRPEDAVVASASPPTANPSG
jgi:membrane associated rhomboid family serine protease